MTSYSLPLAGCIALLACSFAVAQSPTPAPHLDQTRFEIPWYEIARYPNRSEKKCAGDATILYAEGDKPYHLQIVAACNLKDGTSQVHNYNARSKEKTWTGMLQETSWPFYLLVSHKYWVLAVDPDYTWALVGTPNRKELWILSKTPTMSPDLLTQIKATATGNGYDVARLVMVPNSGASKNSVATVKMAPSSAKP